MKLTLPRLFAALTLLGIFAMAARPSADNDTWWHLRAGAWIVEHRAVPTADPFSHTRAGVEWLYPGWIVEMPLYELFANFGYAGLNFFTALCVTLTFVSVYQCCAGPPFVKAVTLILAAAASAIYWSARPQIVSFLLAGVFAYILHQYRWQKINRLWLLPPLMIVWANAHGGFAIGFILMVLTWVGQAVEGAGEFIATYKIHGDWRLGLGAWVSSLVWLSGIGLACAVAVTINPAGPVMLFYPFKTVAIDTLGQFIQEWQSPNFHRVDAQLFLWLLLAVGAALAVSPRKINFTDALLVAGVAYLGFLAWRNVGLLAIVAPPVITRHFGWAWETVGARAPQRAETPAPRVTLMLNWAILLLVALAAGLKFFVAAQPAVNEAEIAQSVPVGAAEFVKRTQPAGNLFNSYNFGGYLAWALYPKYPVYVDGRTDLYDDVFLREYLTVARGRPGYLSVLDKYAVKVAIVESNSLVSDALARAGWGATYSDALATVYERP